MAIGGTGEASSGRGRAEQYSQKVTVYVIFTIIIAAIGGSLFGYDLGVSGGVTSMDEFLKLFFPKIYARKQQHIGETDYCKFDNQLLTLFTSSLYFAALVATFGASHLTRNKGRRASILFGAVSFFAGAICNALAPNIFFLILGRAALGVGIGFSNQAVPLYLSEMAPTKIRGAINLCFQLTTCVGILVANYVNQLTEGMRILGHPWGWRLSLGLAAAPATLMFVGGLFLPETPNSLVEQGKLEEARRVLEKVRGTKNVDAEFADLIDASNEARAITKPFRNLWKRKNRPQLIIGALGIPSFQQLTGMNSMLFYAPVFFQSLGFGSNTALVSSSITSGALVVGAIVAIFIVDRVGRRKLFIESSIEMFCYMIAIGVILALKFGKGVPISRSTSSCLVIIICLFCFAYGRSWGPLGWLVPSELFSLEIRSAGQSVVVCMNMIFTALIAQLFLVSLCHLKYAVFFVFAALIFFMGSFIFILLPETKKIPIEEIYLLFQKHWIWKTFVVPKQPPLPVRETPTMV